MNFLDAAHAAQGPGASVADWHAFMELGLTADLLPVVSDPSAKISPLSKMKGKGKTPSQFNKDGDVVGLPGWTQQHSTERQVQRWAADSRLGICVQTRRLKAIDIDIADPVHAVAVEELLTMALGQLPLRCRSNSGKRLLVFELAVDFPKRVIKTAHGIIELLSTGQQFIAVGAHYGNDGQPSGARYHWPAGLPKVLPQLTMAEVDVAWQALIEQFALPDGASEARNGMIPAKPRLASDLQDPMVSWLDENGWVTSFERDGRVDVRCPWEDGHSVDSGPSSTSWFPAGVGGFAQGHFRCLHASCSGRTDGDFIQATGYGMADFEVVPAPPGDVQVLPAFDRDKRSGKITATRGNLAQALNREGICGLRIRKDIFQGAIMVAAAGTEQWRRLTDSDITDLCKRLESGTTGFVHIPAALIREMVDNIAEHNQFDSAQQWLNGLVWDGVHRVAFLLSRYLGAADTPYTRAVATYMLTAAAGRVLSPGIKADMVPVLAGPQGGGKSTVVAALAPSPDAFLELDLGKADDDQAREMRGRLIVELGELKGLGSRAHEALKAFISRRVDVWVPKFKEHATEYARRSIFVGTTNSQEFLADDTGHRRWLPVEVHGHDSPSAVAAAGEAVARDRDQLWAEGAALFARDGIAWQAAEALARPEHARFEVVEPWAAAISRWLEDSTIDDVPRDGAPFTTEDVLVGAVRVELRQVNDTHRKRVVKVLGALGYVGQRRMVGGVRATWWQKAQHSEFA